MPDNFETLKKEMHEKDKILKTQQIKFANELLNGLGDEINDTLNKNRIINNGGLLKSLKRLFKKR